PCEHGRERGSRPCGGRGAILLRKLSDARGHIGTIDIANRQPMERCPQSPEIILVPADRVVPKPRRFPGEIILDHVAQTGRGLCSLLDPLGLWIIAERGFRKYRPRLAARHFDRNFFDRPERHSALLAPDAILRDPRAAAFPETDPKSGEGIVEVNDVGLAP